MAQTQVDHERWIEGPTTQLISIEEQIARYVIPTSALENALAPSKSRKHNNAPNGNTTSNVVPVYQGMNSAHKP